jgi:hypothetical protein
MSISKKNLTFGCLLMVSIFLPNSCKKDDDKTIMDKCYECSKNYKSDDAFYIGKDYESICPSEFSNTKDFENTVNNAIKDGWSCE